MPLRDPQNEENRHTWHQPAHPHGPHARDRHAWIAPLLSTLLTLPGIFLTAAYAMLSPMACDSCTPAQLADFESSFHTAFLALLIGTPVPLILLIVGWSLPWRQRFGARRKVLAALAPVSVLALYALFTGLVAWPHS